MAQRSFRCRGWCFTINNDTYEDLDLLLNCDKFDYMIIGFETGESGTDHIQGYIHFTNAISQKSVKKIIPRGHLAGARGTPDENVKYCSKDGDFYEFGEKPKPGNRTDIEEIKRLIAEGTTMEYIMDNYPSDYIRYFKGMEKMRNLVEKKKIKREVKYLTQQEFKEQYDGEYDCFICNHPTQLNHYDNEYYLVLWSTKNFNSYDLELLTMGHPLYTANRVISPNSVLIIKEYLNDIN